MNPARSRPGLRRSDPQLVAQHRKGRPEGAGLVVFARLFHRVGRKHLLELPLAAVEPPVREDEAGTLARAGSADQELAALDLQRRPEAGACVERVGGGDGDVPSALSWGR